MDSISSELLLDAYMAADIQVGWLDRIPHIIWMKIILTGPLPGGADHRQALGQFTQRMSSLGGASVCAVSVYHEGIMVNHTQEHFMIPHNTRRELQQGGNVVRFKDILPVFTDWHAVLNGDLSTVESDIIGHRPKVLFCNMVPQLPSELGPRHYGPYLSPCIPRSARVAGPTPDGLIQHLTRWLAGIHILMALGMDDHEYLTDDELIDRLGISDRHKQEFIDESGPVPFSSGPMHTFGISSADLLDERVFAHAYKTGRDETVFQFRLMVDGTMDIVSHYGGRRCRLDTGHLNWRKPKSNNRDAYE